MTDTHDTNLPEKPVELEEEKKTAEVSEPATTETPAEEIVVGKAGRASSEAARKRKYLPNSKRWSQDVENVAQT